MLQENNISLLCQQFISSSEDDQSDLVETIAYGGEVAFQCLMTYLCEQSVNIKRYLPDYYKFDINKRSGNPELVRKAYEADLIAYMPVAQQLLQSKVSAFAYALIMMCRNTAYDRDLFEVLELHVEHYLRATDRTSWAMALVLLEAASDLDEIASKWIKAGYDKTGVPGGRTQSQLVYSMLYNMVNARAGIDAAYKNIVSAAQLTRTTPEQYEAKTLERAYAYFVGS